MSRRQRRGTDSRRGADTPAATGAPRGAAAKGRQAAGPSTGSEAPEDLEAVRRELESLAGALLEEAAELRRRYEELERLVGGSSSEAADAGRDRTRVSGEPPSPAPEATQVRDADPVRLMAVELALAGRSRAEAEEYLRRSYGVTADAELLDSVFGRTEGAGA